MKLYHSPTSPFVRKCLVCARETGLIERITLEPAAAHPVARDRALVAHNPLGQVPTLITDDGSVLYDSRVICEHFDELSGGRLLPARGAARLAVLVEQALADGLLDAAVLTRYETAVRPEALRWPEWVTGQLDKVSAALAELERAAPTLGGRIDLGTISIACALGYLDFRYAHLRWRDSRPALAGWFDRFAARESMRATQPPAA
jgi:glutathione S-transferase